MNSTNKILLTTKHNIEGFIYQNCRINPDLLTIPVHIGDSILTQGSNGYGTHIVNKDSLLNLKRGIFDREFLLANSGFSRTAYVVSNGIFLKKEILLVVSLDDKSVARLRIVWAHNLILDSVLERKQKISL